MWTATLDDLGGDPVAQGTFSIASGAVPQGRVRTIGSVNFTMPDVTAVRRVVVNMELQVAGIRKS